MNKWLLSLTSLLIVPIPGMASDADVKAAAKDICKCGFPPPASCFDELEKKYPNISQRPDLQNRTMGLAQNLCGPGSSPTLGASSKSDTIPEMVGNPDLDVKKLPPNVADALKGINKVVSSTKDCSTIDFKVAIPPGWQCRKQDNKARDVTLYTKRNTLNVSLGLNQGMTSCSVITICTNKDYELSTKFATKEYTNPMVGAYEYAGNNKANDKFKVTITSNTKPTKEDLDHMRTILNSFNIK